MLSIVRHLTLGALLVAAVSIGFSAAQYGLSDIYFFQGRSYLEAWRKSADPTIDAREWEVGSGAVNKALALMPGYPNYLELLGDMYLLRSADVNLDEIKRAEDQGSALEYYRAALVRRPGWSYGWVKFAYAKNVANEVDEEMSLAVSRSLALGPYEPAISSTISEIALTSWYSFDQALQLQMLKEVVKMAKLDARRTMKLAMDNEMMTIVCPQVATIPGWEMPCENPEEPTPVSR